MKSLLYEKRNLQMVGGLGLFIVTLLLLQFVAGNSAAANMPDGLAGCIKIEDDTERLRCFDTLAGRKPPGNGPARAAEPRAKPPATALPEGTPVKEAKGEPVAGDNTSSVMARHWDLDAPSRAARSIIRPHRPNYMLPVAYNSTLNQEPMLDVSNNARAQHTEAKFQISFKTKLWEDVMGEDMDLWFGYTQLAFWQLYNAAFSSPFREVNYEPELLLNFRTDYDLLGLKGRIVNLGINHQSNGRANPLSRSWNRVMANFGFEKENLSFLLKTWYRIPENASDDDNSNITAYMGYGELWGFYYWKGHRFAVMLRNNLRADNKGAVQLDWSFPFPFIDNKRFSGYIQYFNGYGESLIDYNNTVNRASIGFMLNDWH